MSDQNEILQIELAVQGMTGMGGEPKVVKALEELPGIKKANASFPEKKAIVIYDRALVTVEQMNKALLKVGCVATLKENFEENIVTQFNESISKSDHQNTGLICYCFEYTTHDIEQDFIKNGQSFIMAKIVAEKKANGCDCKNKNPKGKGCLPDVCQVVDRLKGKDSFAMISGNSFNGKNLEDGYKNIRQHHYLG